MSRKNKPDANGQTDLLGAPIAPKEKAATRPYQTNPVVQEVPVACPRCRGTESKVTKTTPFPRRPLRIAARTYPGLIVRRRTCAACACRFVSNAPLGEPA